MNKTLDEYQETITEWGEYCFGKEHMNNPRIRALRLGEEAIEFCQAAGVDPSKLHGLIDYVYSRPAGNRQQELGGVAVTAMAAASSIGCKLSDLLRTEVERVLAKPREHFAARNQTKIDAGFK